MAKKVSKKRKPTQKKQTNWTLIGGVVIVGVIGLFALLFLSLQAPDTTAENRELETYCEDNPNNCVIKGDANAPVTIVEVSDYGCPHCRTFNAETAPLIDERYVASGEVRYISVPFALRSQDGSYPTAATAVASLCANEQPGFYDDYQTAMFNLQGSPSFNTFTGFVETAETLSMDVDAFSSCLADNNYEATVLANTQMAQRAGISATPSFFINGRKVEGAQPFAAFQRQIDALLES